MSDEITAFEQQIPGFLQIIEVALRSGYSLLQALEMVHKDMDGVMSAEAQLVLDDVKSGMALPEALNHWLTRMPSQSLDLIVATFHTQFETGGNLADKLQFIAQALPKLKLR